MTGVSFWAYAGSAIALVGVAIAALGFTLALRSKASGAITSSVQECDWSGRLRIQTLQ